MSILRRFLLDVLINSALGLAGAMLIGGILACAWQIVPDDPHRSACAQLSMTRTADQRFTAYTSRDGRTVCTIVQGGRTVISLTSPHRSAPHDHQ